MMRIGVGSMGGMLLTDKLVFGRLEGFGAWSLDSATPVTLLLATIAYPAHASRPGKGKKTGKSGLMRPLNEKEWARV
ncbi:MAG: hypothetical protein NTU72_09065 [Fimbriimonadales bacterium]|nr:hypothetical protein [Fimbriimonadales bacterium]